MYCDECNQTCAFCAGTYKRMQAGLRIAARRFREIGEEGSAQAAEMVLELVEPAAQISSPATKEKP